MSKHKHRHNEDNMNPNLSPNMLMILLLILGTFGRKPIYYLDEDLLNNRHNKTSNNGKSKTSDIGYTGGVLSEDNDSQDKAGSNINYDSGGMGYSGGYSRDNPSEYELNENVISENCEEKDSRFMRSVSDNAECSEIINSEVVPEYPNMLVRPYAISDQVVVNVPVVLTQFEIEFACEAVITLDQPALDIKRIKKNVFLDECRLIPKANKLFIGGIVRKNIEYSTKDNIRHSTVEIPFRCTTEVEYFTPPIISSKEDQLEIETIRSDGMGIDLSEKAYISSEEFNEKIYCKLVSDEIRELDIADEEKGENENPECEKLFETLTEKMVVRLNLKLIQEQQIEINK